MNGCLAHLDHPRHAAPTTGIRTPTHGHTKQPGWRISLRRMSMLLIRSSLIVSGVKSYSSVIQGKSTLLDGSKACGSGY